MDAQLIRLKEIKVKVELLVLMTPTSNFRSVMSDLNIVLGRIIEDYEAGAEMTYDIGLVAMLDNSNTIRINEHIFQILKK